MPFFIYAAITLSPALSATPLERPYYGIEPTVTSISFQKMPAKDLIELVRQVDAGGDPRSKLHLFARKFPDQYLVFTNLVNGAFGEQNRSRRLAHKGLFPAYQKDYPDGFWLRYQFEHQAIELQAQPLTLLDFLGKIGLIDRDFFSIAFDLHLTPQRYWGMGHIRESLDRGYPSSRPEVFRNRVVSELVDAPFWSMMGPNNEADLHWDKFADGMVLFQTWLKYYDSWLERIHSPDDAVRDEVVTEMRAVIRYDPLLERLGETRKQLYGLAYVYLNADASFGPEDAPKMRGIMLELLMSMLVRWAYSAISLNGKVCAVMFRPAVDPEHPLRESLEFRRIPAQENADEIAMWMRLLEGRWQRAVERNDLVELTRPALTLDDDAKIRIFVDYVESAGMNPLDFKKFLTPMLAKLVPKDSSMPRWAQIREALRCEAALEARAY